MIKTELDRIVKDILNNQKDMFEDQDIFYVQTKISADNRISVFIDSLKGININDCAVLSRLLEDQLDREKEDFELTVSSAGLDQPFIVIEQYKKNIGKQIKVKDSDGRKLKGELFSVNNEGITLIQKITSTKNKEFSEKEIKLNYTDIKEAKVVITF